MKNIFYLLVHKRSWVFLCKKGDTNFQVCDPSWGFEIFVMKDSYGMKTSYENIEIFFIPGLIAISRMHSWALFNFGWLRIFIILSICSLVTIKSESEPDVSKNILKIKITSLTPGRQTRYYNGGASLQQKCHISLNCESSSGCHNQPICRIKF